MKLLLLLFIGFNIQYSLSQNKTQDSIQLFQKLEQISKTEDTLQRIKLLDNYVTEHIKRAYPFGIYHTNKALLKIQRKRLYDDSIIRYIKGRNVFFSKDNEYQVYVIEEISAEFLKQAQKDSSIYYSLKSIKKAQQIQHLKTLIRTYITTGNKYMFWLEYDNAFIYYSKADSLCSVTKYKNTSIHASALQYIGYTVRKTSGYEGAMKYYLKAKNILETTNDSIKLNELNIALGQAYTNLGDYNKAIKLLNKAVSFSLKNNKINDKTYSTIVRGYTHLKMKNYALAEKDYLSYYDMVTKDNDQLKTIRAIGYLAYFYKESNNEDRAISLYEDAINESVAKKDYMHLVALYPPYIELIETTKNHKKLSQVYKKYIESLSLNENNKRLNVVTGLEEKYNSKEKEQEIVLLTAQNKLAEEQKANQRTLFLAAIAIVSLAGLFFFFQYRNRLKTNKKLREIDAAKSTFFTNISHEFRTPLTLIKGPIEDQLENTTLPLAQYRNLKAAHRNTERLENLVGQLLSLSKLESSTTRLSVQPENLDKFIRIYTEAFQYQSDEQGLTFSLSTEITERISWFDQDIFEKIIYNLLGNALKFTSENGSIEVKGITRDNHLFLEVYNTSTPYSDTEIALLFTRFYQSTPNNSGTGIGLSLIKQLVALHKGTISMKNSGDGILFCVQIPVSKEFYSEAEILNEHLHSDLVPKTDHIRTEVDPAVLVPEDAPIILVVDDSVDILHYLKSIFQDTYEVLAAKDGAEAIILAKEHIPDIIVSDILMPKMDGYQFTEQIKNDPLTSHIPIILLTAKDKTIDELEAMDLGADSYMTKPFSSKLLLAKVQNLIENRRKLQQRFAQELILTPKEIAVTTADEEFLTRLQDVLEKNLTKTDFSASKFSDVMFMNRMQLHRKLKALTGLSSSEFLKTQRLKMATQLMKTKDLSVSEIGYTIGFNDPSYFTKCFKQEYGMTPKEYTVKHKE
jgi:signal transduction histidine kinase/DNA-binding response OmpR family regulator